MDRMTQITTHPAIKKLASKLPIPVNLPTLIRRDRNTDWKRPLLGRRIAVTLFSANAARVRQLAELGAAFVLVGAKDHVAGAADLARSAGRAAEQHPGNTLPGALANGDKVDGLILDVAGLGGAKQLLGELQPILPKLATHCRLVFVTRLGKSPTPTEEAEAEGVVGFVKSLARELGKKAITCNVIEVHDGAADEQVAAVEAFLVSDKARYVTAQRVRVSGANHTLASKASPSCDLAGAHVLVTGGARGLGASIARILARQGASVTVLDLPSAREAATEVCASISRSGGKAQFFAADVTRPADRAQALAAATKAFGPLAALINNAGITRDRTFAKLKQEQWDQAIQVNYEAAAALTDEALALPAEQRTGHLRVVFLSSVVGISGNFGQTNYTLSKAAVIGHVRALGRTRGDATVNAVAPGFIDTVLTREVPWLNRELGKQMIALLQAGEPEDIGEVVAFLASSAAQAINGETLRVDGGMFFGA